MYTYTYDEETGGILLTDNLSSENWIFLDFRSFGTMNDRMISPISGRSPTIIGIVESVSPTRRAVRWLKSQPLSWKKMIKAMTSCPAVQP